MDRYQDRSLGQVLCDGTEEPFSPRLPNISIWNVPLTSGENTKGSKMAIASAQASAHWAKHLDIPLRPGLSPHWADQEGTDRDPSAGYPTPLPTQMMSLPPGTIAVRYSSVPEISAEAGGLHRGEQGQFPPRWYQGVRYRAAV